ncbi:effector-associated constant component EACC1 [Catellatospora paridis]|uniref:effector-associated constant component EACC1 n=1 Tax=Catellatospora paridis TaxID=1617086 RepID=UPI0018AFF4DF|nr:hypothetical protein [Catellatospora paridis]
MQIQIAVDGDSTQLESLWGWVHQERELRGRVRIARPPVAAGQMGAVAELAVALASTGAATALARAVSTWLIHRRANITVNLTLPDGSTIKVTAERAKDEQEMLRTILQAAAQLPGQPPTAES